MEKRFSLRTSQHLIDKIGYIAKYNGRTKNKEIEMVLRRHVAAFEKEQGKITEQQLQELKDGMEF